MLFGGDGVDDFSNDFSCALLVLGKDEKRAGRISSDASLVGLCEYRAGNIGPMSGLRYRVGQIGIGAIRDVILSQRRDDHGGQIQRPVRTKFRPWRPAGSRFRGSSRSSSSSSLSSWRNLPQRGFRERRIPRAVSELFGARLFRLMASRAELQGQREHIPQRPAACEIKEMILAAERARGNLLAIQCLADFSVFMRIVPRPNQYEGLRRRKCFRRTDSTRRHAADQVRGQPDNPNKP